MKIERLEFSCGTSEIEIRGFRKRFIAAAELLLLGRMVGKSGKVVISNSEWTPEALKLLEGTNKGSLLEKEENS